MNLRLSSLRAMFIHQRAGRLAAAAAALAFAVAGVGAGAGNALAAPGDAASASEGASASASTSYAAGSQYTVRPGQSLNDVAIAVTQSHDRATLARASRALFDSNPNAFMSHDPSRMRMGALLTVPALDASGALAASSASAGAAAVAASAPAPASASNVAAAVGAASGGAQVNAAAASAASAAAHAAAPATPAVTSVVSAAPQATPATPGASAVSAGGAAVTGAVSSAPLAGSQAAASATLPASGANVWSGSIQPSASEPAEGASAPGATAAPATVAQPASQAHAQVSSLQQLLALKNRVLMELQKHGIGGSTTATGTASTGAQPSMGASSAAVVAGHSGAANSTSNEPAMSQTNLSVAAAVGAALVALLAALRLRRRKREGIASAEATRADDNVTASARAAGAQEIASTREQLPVSESADVSDDVAMQRAAALVEAEREAAEGEAAAREAAERAAAEREAEQRQAAAREREAAERAEAEREAAEHAAELAAERATADGATAEREAAALQPETTSAPFPAQEPAASEHPWQERQSTPAPFEPAQPTPDVSPAAHGGFTSEPIPPANHENFDGATTAASIAAAAELGAEALPMTPLEPVSEVLHQEELPPRRLQWDDEPAAPLTKPHDDLNVPQPAVDFTQQYVEPHTTSPFGQPDSDASTHPAPAAPFSSQDTSPASAPHFEQAPAAQAQPAPAVPTEFPRDAVDAFSSLDMPLPPRVESSDAAAIAPASLATQPVASPETAAHQAVAPHDADDDAPHIANEIASGTAGHAAVAGLGAAGFGALNLDFDLELPPSPAQPLPAFTQADLKRIARNKLDLAAEYIDLGDLSGARALINEVIEANDPATRIEARTLLSTLAPLS
ncbi:FimV/HubP family polar landmark protein [Paraburkholderia sp. IMGN_8]|uniref:FimV/HubP family polar landmark protein n=1 Tax=Paraburkholderia sp. IMGN_8 TaxID=3136564 RepID=UPI0031012FC5